MSTRRRPGRPTIPILVCLAALFLLAAGGEARAQAASCSASMSALNFGVVDMTLGTAIDTSATYSISCTGQAGRTIRMCLNIGEGAYASPGSGLRLMSNGTPNMQFGVYTNAARTTMWGSYWWSQWATYPAVQLDLTLGGGGAASTSRTVYGRILASQQTLTTGAYSNAFSGFEAVLEYGYQDGSDCVSGAFITGYAYPAFTASATYSPVCRVSATNMNFPTTGLLTSNVDQTSSLSLTCSNGTPWTTGLNNGTGVGATGPTDRRMTGPAAARIVYGLYRDAARSLPWGATAGQTTSGTGTGLSQAATVYGRVAPQTTPAPGLYSDTIVVTVTY